jgi:hypothetical protein
MKVVSSLLIEKRATQMERALSRKPRVQSKRPRRVGSPEASLRRFENVM